MRSKRLGSVMGNGVMEYWSNGVLERWRVGSLGSSWLVVSFLHPSIAPILHSLNAQLALDAEFLHAFAQRGAGDAEQLGGVDLVAVGFFEGLDDQFALHGGKDLHFGIAPRPPE